MKHAPFLRDLFWVLLFPLAGLWATVAFFRRRLVRPRYRSSLPVLCVGNLHSGGSGKTPLVASISKYYQATAVAILSRGYGGELEHSFGRVEKEEATGARRFGDEPWMLSQTVSHPIFVGKDRVASVKKVEAMGSFSGVLLDDGFQHLALAKQVSLVAVDVNRSLDEANCIPLGELREPLSAFRYADAVVLTGVEIGDAAKRWREFLATRFPSLPVFPAKLTLHLPKTSGTETFGAFSGIASPERFERGLRALCEIKWLRSFSDHHPYSEADLDRLVRAKAEQGVTHLLTTEKDFFKVGERLKARGERVSPVRIEYDLSPDFWYFLENRWISK